MATGMTAWTLEQAIAAKAAELKKHYAVFGYFYDRQYQQGNYPSREILDIVAQPRVPFSFDELISHQPELLVVMMNPGSSRPLDKAYVAPLLKDNLAVVESRHLVPTMPDNAQYQIQRFMALQGFQHARVLNLSDLREPKSALFAKLFTTLGPDHSVFSPNRREYLHSLIGQPAMVLKAWSSNVKLLPLAIQAEQALQAYPTLGLATQPHFYRYPSPMLQAHKEQWLRDVAAATADFSL